MNICIPKKVLKSILSIVDNANYAIKKDPEAQINTKSLCLKASEGKVNVIAMNQEMFIDIPIIAEITEEGIAVLDNKTLIKVVTSLNDGDIVLRTKDDKLILESNGSEVEINMLTSVKKFDKLPEFDEKEQITEITAGVMSTCLKAVSSAVPDNLPQFALNNSCVEFEFSSISFVGFDGYKLIKKTLELEDDGIGIDFNKKLLIPTAATNAIQKILTKGKANIILSFCNIKDREYLVIDKDDITIAVRLNNYDFPDYRKLLINEFDYTFTINTKELQTILKSVTGLSGKEVNPIHFIFEAGKVNLRIVTESATVSKWLSIDNIEGNPQRLKVLAKSLKDVAPYFDSERIRFKVLNNGLVTLQPIDAVDYIFVTRAIE